jgi:hypothetical protein
MRGLYVSEQQKQSEMKGEFTAQNNALKEKIADLDTQILKYRSVSFLIHNMTSLISFRV